MLIPHGAEQSNQERALRFTNRDKNICQVDSFWSVATLDATSAFLQLELDGESSKLTTFATPFGRYKFLRLPFGISSALEVFHRTVSEIFSDIKGVEIYTDDSLIHALTKHELDLMLQKVLEKCRILNLNFNYAKCSFEQSELRYLGHTIGQGVIKPYPAKITAITDMPKPENQEATARLLGMATYLGKFCSNLAEITAPLRQLTKKIHNGCEAKQRKPSGKISKTC